MNVSELKPRQAGVNIELDVIDKGLVREFSKFGRSGRVCTATARDESGQVKLSLWNEDCDRVNVGDRIKMVDGFVNEYQGEIQLTTGRAGKIEIIGSGAKPEEKADEKPAKPAKEHESDDESDDEETDLDDVDEELVE